MFPSGYSACFLGALKFAAHRLKLHVPNETTVTETVGIRIRSEGGFGLEVELIVALPGLDREEAQLSAEAAHQTYPYSHATRDNIDVRLTVL